MTSHVLAAWSAALVAWSFGGLLFGLWRVCETWGENVRRTFLLMGGMGVSYSFGCHQAMTLWAYETAQYGTLIVDPWIIAQAINYRLGSSFGLLAFAGAATHPRCGHKGWLALTALGVLAAGLSAAF